MSASLRPTRCSPERAEGRVLTTDGCKLQSLSVQAAVRPLPNCGMPRNATAFYMLWQRSVLYKVAGLGALAPLLLVRLSGFDGAACNSLTIRDLQQPVQQTRPIGNQCASAQHHVLLTALLHSQRWSVASGTAVCRLLAICTGQLQRSQPAAKDVLSELSQSWQTVKPQASLPALSWARAVRSHLAASRIDLSCIPL